MYECPNCAGNLKFNIEKQKLYCEFCGTEVDPYEMSKERDAEEHSDEYEVTIFTCPQCGGEIISEDNTAATFCSFCGASTILSSRVSKEKRPVRIIPFLKTKEDCKNAYVHFMKRALFAPKEFKNKEQIERFRGIYMPYWMYSFEKEGPVSFSGRKTYRRGDYIYTDHYQLSCEIEEDYKGLTFDAASSFSDHLSGAIAPFNLNEGKKFAPTFLSGFYADTNDVEKEIYEQDARDIITEDGCERLLNQKECKRYLVDKEDVWNAVCPTKYQAELVMLPVWFLSYRNGDRISYAVVNGQTGKVAAEIPIDIKKYFLGSMILTIPIFLILNLFFTFTPTKLLWIALVLLVICFLVINKQLTEILLKNSGEWDKGFMSKNPEKDNGEDELQENIEEGATKNSKALTSILWSLLRFLLWPILIFTFFSIDNNIVMIFVILFIVHNLFFVTYRARRSISKKKKRKSPFWQNWKEKKLSLIRIVISAVIGGIILFTHPVSDLYYYFGVVICLVCVAWSMVDIMKQHNELTTRPLPQFNHRGGEDYE